ncbi:uncharacterized protein LOC124807237 [Hydra vulgaris]|uniref:uncharacterized protein LOC124807237 n=1 Tax=Hydra vulgaris TaxID=6087 RepID=UPI001F5F9BA7|nr:uncharacterized protein LOC124807237 [Hydra vulgaris]
MDTFISRLKGETDSYLTQFKTVAENENVTIDEDYFDENVSSIFDEATGCDNEGDEDKNNESEVPSEENHESNNFSSLHTKLLYFCLLYKLSNSAILCLLTVLNEEGVDVPVSVYLFKKL